MGVYRAEAPETPYSSDTAGEEMLWSSFFETRSHVARNRLVLFYAHLVNYVVERYVAGNPWLHDLDDMYQAGALGLIDAVERFDPTDGYRFSTYACHRIRGSIIDGLRSWDTLSKRARTAVKDYEAAQEHLVSSMHRRPTIGETAGHLGRSVADVAALAVWASRGSVMTALSLLDSDDVSELLDFSLDPAAVGETNWTRDSIRDALAACTERQRAALVLHHLEGFSKSEVAEMLGVDRSRVTQLLCQGTLNLRNQLKGSGALPPHG